VEVAFTLSLQAYMCRYHLHLALRQKSGNKEREGNLYVIIRKREAVVLFSLLVSKPKTLSL
jgi:hypothetical protein